MANTFTKKSNIITKTVIILIVTGLFVLSLFFASQIEIFLGLNNLIANKVSFEKIDKEPFSLHYIDVGQADCSLIILPDGKKMLIDAGERTNESKTAVKEYLVNKNVKTIDYLVLTHSDSDHAGGMKMVFDEFEVRNVFRPFQIAINTDGSLYAGDPLGAYIDNLPPETIKFEYNTVSSKTYKDFIDSAYSETYTDGNTVKQAVVKTSYDGLELLANEYSISWFAPAKLEGYSTPIGYGSKNDDGYMTKYFKEANDYSPIISVRYNNNNFIFTGDAESVAEKSFVASYAGRSAKDKEKIANCAVYKAGHHGSKTSSNKDLLAILNPEIVVVSAGQNNNFGHPNPEFISRLYAQKNWTEDRNKLYRTDINGTIAISLSGENVILALGEEKHSVFSAVKWWQLGLGIYAVIVLSVIFIKGNVTLKKTAKIIKNAGSR